ncbi:hypothetical protein MRB53_001173 [Persea americana]|uniref:Uncharacterized protein n=1 Tax=Persea americana TaxID=3435 RepID=A0ACC2MR97_PERAE|nr:hypothetical protein MRB53_001173 [Persea americana]
MQQGLSIIVDGEEGMLQRRPDFFWSVFAEDPNCCFGFCSMFCLAEIARVADSRVTPHDKAAFESLAPHADMALSWPLAKKTLSNRLSAREEILAVDW